MYATKRWVRAVSALPMCLVVGLFGFEWYIYNIVYTLPMLSVWTGDELTFSLVRTALFNAFWLLAMWSYARSALSDPGLIPPDWAAKMREWESTGVKGVADRNWDLRRTTMCFNCGHRRPERAHHCSICGRCVMRMDHHCPWIGNCVGFKNHKYFILMTFYGMLACAIVAFTAFPMLRGMIFGGLRRPTRLRKAIASGAFMQFSLGCVLAASFCVSLGALFFSHLWLLFFNLTSIEVGDWGRNRFNLGFRANAEQVMGRFDLAWFLPVPAVSPMSDGLWFPTREQAERRGTAHVDAVAMGRPAARGSPTAADDSSDADV